jgi:hypothetical protein
VSDTALAGALATTLAWMSPLAALAAGVAALELLALRRDPVMRALAQGPLGTRTFAGVLVLQCVGALALGLVGAWWGAALAAVGVLLSAARFGGTVNGGSDAMLFTVLVALAVAQAPGAGARVRAGALLYVAAQCTLSYVRAGWVKLRERDWWTGDALVAFLALPAYGAPAWARASRAVLRPLGIAVLALELAAPLAWTGPRAALVAIGVALAFHAGVAATLGLNRFLLAWGAALPSLWFAAQRVG